MDRLKLSFLDLGIIWEGGDAKDAILDMTMTAKHIENLEFNRMWVAEHHNTIINSCSATSILIGQIAQATSKIRVGSGGIMLPNHAPLVVAEQFGTLETIYPGRIDLGLGKGSGDRPINCRCVKKKQPDDLLSL